MTAGRTHRPVLGVLFCVVALLAFAIQDAVIKGLISRYPVLEILALRSTLVVLLLASVGLWYHGLNILKTKQPKPMLARGVLAFFAFSSYYLALSRIPLADAAAVYMTAPLFVTALSMPLLGEHVGWHRWAAVILGFVSVLVMLNPGSAVFRIEAAIPMFSALCYASIPIINRKIGLSEHAITMALYTTFTYLILCVIAALLIYSLPRPEFSEGVLSTLFRSWRALETRDWWLVGLSGVVFTVALLCITQAYRIAVVSTIAPFEYIYLVWAALLGYLVFGDVPGLRTALGAAAVVACGCYVMYRERVMNR